MNIYEKYFDISYYEHTKVEKKGITSLLSDDILFISGDFYGIQKFIFEGLSTKNASKVIRAKSAFIQIYTSYLARYICQQLSIGEDNILSLNAGKFEIISPNKDASFLKNIQKKVDEYFLKNFFGLTGVSIIYIECKKDDFNNSKRYKALRNNITLKIEKKKFKKFDLVNERSFVLNYDKDINNQNLCKICNLRKVIKKDDNCGMCNKFVMLGEKLAGNKLTKYTANFFDDFKVNIAINEQLRSYVLMDKNAPASFEYLAQHSCENPENSIRALAVLKADVDSMGQFLQESDITDSFENFDTFSRTLDNFFSLYIPKLMRKKYQNTYTVFAGGDDLFLIGAWNDILKLSRTIQEAFRIFIKGKLSISFGIALVKPSHPISHLADYTEHLLKQAKFIDKDKNAITLFNETVKWEAYLKTFDKLSTSFQILKTADIKTAFLYRLLEIVDMSKKVKYEGNVESTIWRSKLSYSFYRNMDKKYEELLRVLNEEIGNNPKETKMFLSEFIYERRES